MRHTIAKFAACAALLGFAPTTSAIVAQAVTGASNPRIRVERVRGAGKTLKGELRTFRNDTLPVQRSSGEVPVILVSQVHEVAIRRGHACRPLAMAAGGAVLGAILPSEQWRTVSVSSLEMRKFSARPALSPRGVGVRIVF